MTHRHLDAAAGEFADQRRAARQFGREGPAGDQVAAFGEDGVIVLRRGILDVTRVLSAFHLHREVAAFDVDAAERRAVRVPFRGLAVGVEQAEKRRVGARGGGGVDQRRSVLRVHLGGAEHRLDRAVREVMAPSAVAVHVDEAGGGVAAAASMTSAPSNASSRSVPTAAMRPSSIRIVAFSTTLEGITAAALTIFTRWGPSAAAGRQHASSPKMGIRVFMLSLFFFVDILNAPAE